MSARDRRRAVIVRGRTRLCALPVVDVVEVMRPQPVERIGELPPFVLGLALIRGAPVPVVALDVLLDGAAAPAGEPPAIGRFVSLRVGDRPIALAVAEVIGLVDLERADTTELPPLLGGAGRLVERIGRLDAELLAVLDHGRLIPDPVWDELDRREEEA